MARRELNLKAVLDRDGEEIDLFALDKKELNEIGMQLGINFMTSIGYKATIKQPEAVSVVNEPK